MDAVNPKTRTRNRRARENALLAAARRLFASLGFEATTTRGIAAEAGCAEGLIHRYFNGKAGLLLAIIEQRISQEVFDLNQTLPIAPTLEEEILQLVEWELERMWDDREFLKVIIPRALLDPSLSEVITRIGPLRRTKAFADRLKGFTECRNLPPEELDALAHFVATTGFMFGFMRPAILQQDWEQSRGMATSMARMVARSFSTDAAAPQLCSSFQSRR